MFYHFITLSFSNFLISCTLRCQSYRTALLELERALGERHAKNLEQSLRILLEEHSTEIKMIRLEAQRAIEVTATETHTRLEEVRAYVLTRPIDYIEFITFTFLSLQLFSLLFLPVFQFISYFFS